ncbi:MAG: LCP family protein [Actinomycetota bacterium]|nr:LCP family protein [Actinomycetota bacterium]
MRKRKRKLFKNILVILVVIVALGIIVFLSYRLFFNREEKLGEDTFILAILEKDEENIEHINNLFLVDILDEKDKKIQIISIPPDLKCKVPGVSIDEVGELYPFGGGSLITDCIASKTGLNTGYYIIITESYFKNLLDEVAPLKVSFVENISTDEFDFIKGESTLAADGIEFLLNHDYSDNYYKEAMESKLYIIKEFFSGLRNKKIELISLRDSGADSGAGLDADLSEEGANKDMSIKDVNVETNISTSYINLLNSYFLDPSTSFYYMWLDKDCFEGANGASDEAKEELEKIILENNYLDMKPEGIKRYFEEIPGGKEGGPSGEDGEGVETSGEEVIKEPAGEKETSEELPAKEDLKIQILNGNYIPGSATATSLKLEEIGYKNFEIGNVEGGAVYNNTTVYFKSGLDDFANEIGQRLNIDSSFIKNFEDESASESDILIIVGLDYREE